MVLDAQELERFEIESELQQTMIAKSKTRIELTHKKKTTKLSEEENAQLEEAIDNQLYSIINLKRTNYFADKYEQEIARIGDSSEEHNESINFIERSLYMGDFEAVHSFLLSKNMCSADVSDENMARRRTIVMLDATGSMVKLLEGTKLALRSMFSHASQIIQDELGQKASFEMQLYAYRNYNAPAAQLLEVSPWETSPESLRQFVTPMKATWGWNEEAIEVALHHAVKEHERKPIGQIIILGDAPPNNREDTHYKREDGRGETYWKDTAFAEPVYFDEQIQKLHDYGIPIHTFYLGSEAKDAFEDMSLAEHNAESKPLDLKKGDAADLLTNAVTENMLKAYVGFGGEGERLVEVYRRKFVSGYVAE